MSDLSTISIPRDTYKSAVEAGIRLANFDGVAAERLRKVADTAKRIAFGTCDAGGNCYCPAIRAGIANSEGAVVSRFNITQRQVCEFMSEFDNHMLLAADEATGGTWYEGLARIV